MPQTRLQRRTWHGDCHSDILSLILEWLNTKDLCFSRLVAHEWFRAGELEGIWACHCAKHWRNKVFIPPNYISLHSQCRAREALALSYAWSRRCSMDPNELTATEFNFRFKEAAGRHWTSLDPFHNGSPARKVRFCSDGRVEWDSELEDLVGGFHWRMDKCPNGRSILYVRHDDMGEFPGLVLLRHPHTWAFVWNGPWVVYSNGELRDPLLTDSQLALSLEFWQWEAAGLYNDGLMEDEATDDEDGDFEAN